MSNLLKLKKETIYHENISTYAAFDTLEDFAEDIMQKNMENEELRYEIRDNNLLLFIDNILIQEIEVE